MQLDVERMAVASEGGAPEGPLPPAPPQAYLLTEPPRFGLLGGLIRYATLHTSFLPFSEQCERREPFSKMKCILPSGGLRICKEHQFQLHFDL